MKMTFDFIDYIYPSKSGRYLTITKAGDVAALWYDVANKQFVSQGYGAEVVAIDVAYWANIEYPKGFKLSKIIERLKNEYETISGLSDIIYDICELISIEKNIADEMVKKLENIYYNDF